MKYAIAQTSGKQFLLKPGQWYDIDFIKDANIGDYIFLNKVLFLRNDNKIQIGQPFLENSKIPAKIIQQVKGKKITVLKTKPKKRYTLTILQHNQHHLNSWNNRTNNLFSRRTYTRCK